MSFRSAVAGILLSIAVVAGTVAATAPAAGAKPATRTHTASTSPFSKSGLLVKRTELLVSDAYCSPSTAARGNGVYQCQTAISTYLGCWPVSRHDDAVVMVCLSAPNDKTAQIFQVATSDLEPATAPADPHPWQIVLDDGSRCTMLTGPDGPLNTAPDGYGYTYWCYGTGKIGALVEPWGSDWTTVIRKGKHFTARGVTRAAMKRSGVPGVTTVGVKKLIYAGAAPKAATRPAATRSSCPSDAALTSALRKAKPGYRLNNPFPTVCSGRWAGHPIVKDFGGYAVFHKAGKTWKYGFRVKKGVPAAFLWTNFAN